MSDLQNQTPADTYKGLLQVGDYTDGITNNTGATALQVTDGAGVNTALALSTTRVGVGNISPQAELDVNGNVVADEYALDGTGSSSSAVAIHAPATNELAIRTDSIERVRIDSDGKVGVATTNPESELHIKGDITFEGETSLSQGTRAKIVHTSGVDANGNESSNDGGLLFKSYDNSTAVDALAITHNGNVGINTSTPSAPLEVSSTTGGVIMPRMATTQRTAISSPTPGEMVYDTDLNKFYGYTSSGWTALH